MADPVFNDFYYLPGPIPVAGDPPGVDFGGPDFEPIGIVLQIEGTTLSVADTEWLLIDDSGAIE